MNEYHLIASNDHFTKREKNIDINKLKRSFASSQFTDLLANVDQDTRSSFHNKACFIVDDSDQQSGIIMSSTHLYIIDDAGQLPIQKLDVEYSKSNYGHVIKFKGYRLAFKCKGPASILKDWKKICDIELDYWWQFRAMKDDYTNGVRGKSGPEVIGSDMYYLYGTNQINLGMLDLDQLFTDIDACKLNDADSYRTLLKEAVQAYCFDSTKRYIYTVDQAQMNICKIKLTGKQVAVSKLSIEHCSGKVFCQDSYVLVLSLPVQSLMSKVIDMSLFNSNLRILDTLDVSSNSFFITRAVLLSTGKKSPPLLIAFNGNLKAFCYALCNDRIMPLIHDYDIKNADDKYPYIGMKVQNSENTAYIPISIKVSSKSNHSTSSILLAGMCRILNTNFVSMFAGILTIKF